jgi:hypothetical protein
MSSRIVLFCLPFLLSASSVPAQDALNPPAVSGYVTHITSPTQFDVNGSHITCDGSTMFGTEKHGIKDSTTTPPRLYIGEAINVYGTGHRKTHTVNATDVVLPVAAPSQLSGLAIITLIPSPASTVKTQPGELLVRADGYRILITPKTATKFDSPLTSLSSITANTWITYEGKLRPDGVLVADSAAFRANVIPKGEDKLRTKAEYDPKAVDPKDKQSGISKEFLGIEVKRIPPYNDPAMQARIERIGASLIPAYQRNLSADDPTKINFRFQLIDEPKWRDAVTLPSGIVLVPRQVVERMQNDSQLATVLADNIACALEKQLYRVLPAVHKMTAAQLAGDAGGFFVPGLSLATLAANYGAASTIGRHIEEQSGRVSLNLLHDAGYDIYEAPKAWWLLAPKKPKDISEIHLPERAAYLYSFIGETWHNQSLKPPPTTLLSSVD